uniref:Hydroxysteroid dehydrogenase-like protein 2 n=1 Tax=Panagrellus redivivus TaxID=6233 RepID=A0A7E4VIG6_PANRE
MGVQNTGFFKGKTALITGASRGIGKAIALKLAKDGANIVIAAKTAQPHPKLPGTIYTTADDIRAAGGKALACIVDVRDEASVDACVSAAVKEFGGIDILINNASAISLTGTLDTPMKKYDLMHSVNTRGTYLLSQKALPHLLKGKNPHILNLSPPLLMEPKWFSHHVAYTMAKYGMSMCVLGMSEEFKDEGVAVNALWPRTMVWTAAAAMLSGSKLEGELSDAQKASRKPEVLADAAYWMLQQSAANLSGKFLIDEEVLLERVGLPDLEEYSYVKNAVLDNDFFLPEKYLNGKPYNAKL